MNNLCPKVPLELPAIPLIVSSEKAGNFIVTFAEKMFIVKLSDILFKEAKLRRNFFYLCEKGIFYEQNFRGETE